MKSYGPNLKSYGLNLKRYGLNLIKNTMKIKYSKLPAVGFLILALLLTSFTAAHKFYVSVTNVEYSESDESLQIISRIFIDDLDNLLKTRYDFDARLATEDEPEAAAGYIERYFNSKFRVFVNGEERAYTFLGKKYDKDLILCFIEVTGVPREDLESVGLQNEILTDLFSEQKNLVHFKVLGKKRSVVLIRENNKGMLNL
ncbi:hypothetical protein RB2501_02520 [Robiginitalea biformata HTCC2501]|uniref:Peptidase E n=2 Tax=Robiginitalea TaxID=252306 RepID=A4CPE1_ROBBH|nr:hypothetical protein RB2501_02520 [Robiginitalea biformata HTCC2501]